MVLIQKYDNNGSIAVCTDDIDVATFSKNFENAFSNYKKVVAFQGDEDHDHPQIIEGGVKILAVLRSLSGCNINLPNQSNIIIRSGLEGIGSELRQKPVTSTATKDDEGSPLFMYYDDSWYHH